jgi:hypothetical protein
MSLEATAIVTGVEKGRIYDVAFAKVSMFVVDYRILTRGWIEVSKQNEWYVE